MIKRVYISVDIEGIWGVANNDSTKYNGAEYDKARENMIDETNIVIENLVKNGVEEILVNDGHGRMNNLIPSKLHSKASMVVSNNIAKKCGMMEGISNYFDACIFIGYHAGAGTEDAVLNHTISSNYIKQIKLNGVVANETLLNAHLAWYYNVPVILISGDNSYIEQAKKDFSNEIVTVETKKSISREAVINIPYEKLLEEYENKIKEAIEKPKIFINCQDDYEIEIEFYKEEIAEFIARVPTVTRKNKYTIAINDTDYLRLYKLCRLCTVITRIFG